jgi:hypothetical protein
MSIVSTLETILLSVLPVFTDSGGKLFIRLMVGWILCPSRHTVTGLLPYTDPDGQEKDDFFVTTDLALAPATVASEFANRWPIEDTFRNVKQYLGAEHPQCWKARGRSEPRPLYTSSTASSGSGTSGTDTPPRSFRRCPGTGRRPRRPSPTHGPRCAGRSGSTDFFKLCPPKHSGRNSRCYLFTPSIGPHNVRKSTLTDCLFVNHPVHDQQHVKSFLAHERSTDSAFGGRVTPPTRKESRSPLGAHFATSRARLRPPCFQQAVISKSRLSNSL